MKHTTLAYLILIMLLSSCTTEQPTVAEKEPIDYVNPFMGNISHLLVPTYPTIHLPNSMLRVYPERADYTGDVINGLPLIVTSHRGSSAFNLSPFQGTPECISHIIQYAYDNEQLTPYSYKVELDEYGIIASYAVSHQSAMYQIEFTEPECPNYLIFNSRNGAIKAEENYVSGYQLLDNNTRVYLYLETEQMPIQIGVWAQSNVIEGKKEAEGENACLILGYGNGAQTINLRYGVSFISEEQAKENLRRELTDYNITALAQNGRAIWNKELSKINIQGENNTDKTIFYTSLYRCFERPVCISENGRYYSAFDGKVHDDNGQPFYTDDWIWDTYRATHPLRVLIDADKEVDIINSYLLMAEQMGNMWMPSWDVPHNVADLINLMGGTDQFIKNLDRTFQEPLGKSKFEFYAQIPDHTGNVGQFSMANEPSLHIPYLYNYAGQPWKTQKRIRTLLHQWFRNDLMGVPGDEDGGDMSAFVVFSMLGFYPVTPGFPAYNIGSPLFPYAKVNLSNGKVFEVIAENCSAENKYIQTATLNGKEWKKPWFEHSDIVNGGKLLLIMGRKPNKAWGSNPVDAPPSAGIK